MFALTPTQWCSYLCVSEGELMLSMLSLPMKRGDSVLKDKNASFSIWYSTGASEFGKSFWFDSNPWERLKSKSWSRWKKKNSINRGLAYPFCKGPERKYSLGFMAPTISDTTSKLCCWTMKAAVNSIDLNESSCVPGELYLWTVWFVFHIIFTAGLPI